MRRAPIPCGRGPACRSVAGSASFVRPDWNGSSGGFTREPSKRPAVSPFDEQTETLPGGRAQVGCAIMGTRA